MIEFKELPEDVFIETDEKTHIWTINSKNIIIEHYADEYGKVYVLIKPTWGKDLFVDIK